jgi:hypothetical protein
MCSTIFDNLLPQLVKPNNTLLAPSLVVAFFIAVCVQGAGNGIFGWYRTFQPFWNWLTPGEWSDVALAFGKNVVPAIDAVFQGHQR